MSIIYSIIKIINDYYDGKLAFECYQEIKEASNEFDISSNYSSLNEKEIYQFITFHVFFLEKISGFHAISEFLDSLLEIVELKVTNPILKMSVLACYIASKEHNSSDYELKTRLEHIFDFWNELDIQLLIPDWFSSSDINRLLYFLSMCSYVFMNTNRENLIETCYKIDLKILSGKFYSARDLYVYRLAYCVFLVDKARFLEAKDMLAETLSISEEAGITKSIISKVASNTLVKHLKRLGPSGVISEEIWDFYFDIVELKDTNVDFPQNRADANISVLIESLEKL